MKKGDCVLCKHEIPRSDSTSAHSDQDFHCLSMYSTVTSVPDSDQDFHCLSMYSTVTSVSLGTQLKCSDS